MPYEVVAKIGKRHKRRIVKTKARAQKFRREASAIGRFFHMKTKVTLRKVKHKGIKH